MPDDEKAHNNLGTLLAQQGRLDEAIEHFSEALRIKPDFVEAHRNLTRARDMARKKSNESCAPARHIHGWFFVNVKRDCMRRTKVQ
jgi:tetratricopeptide (TPR) repeat protein